MTRSTESQEITETDAPVEPGQFGKNSGAYNVTDLRSIGSFEEALALTQSVVGDVLNAEEEIGTGFTVLPTTQKDRLVGVRFIIMSVDFSQGENGMFASMMIVTETGERLIVNDGSTGIYAQLDEWAVRLPAGKVLGGLLVRGLRVSRYQRTDDKGNKMFKDGTPLMAETFYLNV